MFLDYEITTSYMLTPEDIITSNGKYPERAKSPELTPEVLANIDKLLAKVNPFLQELMVTNPKVSSGFRPSSVNAGIPNAAIHSQHMIGCAVDLVDIMGNLEILVSNNDALLKKYGLWQEMPASTIGWVHLDIKDRGLRIKNQFIP